MMVLLVDPADGDVALDDGAVCELAKLGVTDVSLLRDGPTVGIVLEGWLFDPARSAGAAAAALGAGDRAKSLQPLMRMAVSSAANQMHQGDQRRRK